jgi:putative flippase GtrA
LSSRDELREPAPRFQPEGPSVAKSFARSQVAALVATVVDFSTLMLLTEVAGLWYVASTAAGAFLGAVTNFLLGRHWSFEAADPEAHGPMHHQAWRYALVSGGSLLLNSGGVWALTEGFGLPYPVSKGLVAVAVGFLYNYPMQRAFVFRRAVR